MREVVDFSASHAATVSRTGHEVQEVRRIPLNPNSRPHFFCRLQDDANGHRALVSLRWGLIPAWATNPAIGNRLINARSETAAEKPAFRSAFQSRRFLIPAASFCEWQKTGTKHKQP